MSAVREPGPERHGDRRQPNLALVLMDRWAQLAVDRPWRYVVAWAIGIGVANLGLRMLLNDLSLARNAPLAILTAVGFLVFAWVSSAQLTRISGPAATAGGQSGHPQAALCDGLADRVAGPPARRRPGRPVPVALVVPTTREGAGQTRRPTARAVHVPAAPGPRRGRRGHHNSPYLLVPFPGDLLLLGEVTMWSSQAGGIEGHHWTLHRTSGTRLPCRIVCQCGWTSTAGEHTTVLLQLKGHLEESIHSGARLIRTQGQASAELPTPTPPDPRNRDP